MLAVSICDRYLVHLAVFNKAVPDLDLLAVTSILLAAKMEQPVSPSFIRMVRMVDSDYGIRLEKTQLIEMEEDIIRVLDFSIGYTSPIPFLDRYARLFGVDNCSGDKDAELVC